MMTEYLTLLGFILTVLVIGIALGRFIERVDGFLKLNDKDKYIDHKSKNDRR